MFRLISHICLQWTFPLWSGCGGRAKKSLPNTVLFIFPPFFLWGTSSPYIYVFSPFWVNFSIWCKWKHPTSFFCMWEGSQFPNTLCERCCLSLLNGPGTLIKPNRLLQTDYTSVCVWIFLRYCFFGGFRVCVFLFLHFAACIPFQSELVCRAGIWILW